MKTSLKVISILVLSALFLPVLGFAQSPGIPHKFYGTVAFDNGPAPDGLMVEAKVNGAIMGTSVTDDGKYGYGDLLLAANPDNDNAGKTVEFYVSGIKANETAVFANDDDTNRSTNLNLTVTGVIGTIEEASEDGVIENQTAPVSPTQPTNIKLGASLNINVSSETSTNAVVNEVKKLDTSFFTGSTAIIAGNNLLNAYEINITGEDLAISVTISYEDTDIDEDTIKPYRFDGTSWVQISPFTIDKSANTITFTVSSAETPYAIFGEEEEEEDTGGGGATGGGGGGGTTIPPLSYKTGDTDQNGAVNIFDFNTLMVNWGNSPANSAADLDNNGKVDIFDFNLLMVNWG